MRKSLLARAVDDEEVHTWDVMYIRRNFPGEIARNFQHGQEPARQQNKRRQAERQSLAGRVRAESKLSRKSSRNLLPG